MAIGTSKGAFYEDEFHYESAQWDSKYDDNVVDPSRMMQSKSIGADPHNILDDQGNIVDYDMPNIPELSPILKPLSKIENYLDPIELTRPLQ